MMGLGVEVLVTQSTLYYPMDCNPPGFSVHGIVQARILEWVAVLLPGIEPASPALQADSLPSEPPGKPNDGISALIKETPEYSLTYFAREHSKKITVHEQENMPSADTDSAITLILVFPASRTVKTHF